MRYLALALGLLSLAGCGADLCDPAGLADAVRDAPSGQTVQLEPCRVEGVALQLGEGVTLRGQPGSVLVGNGTEPVVQMTDAVLLEVSIEHDGGVGVSVDGTMARVEGVEIRVVRGVAFEAVGLERLDVSGLTVHGPVAPEDGTSIPPLADPTEGAWGVVIREVAQAELVALEIDRVGPWGVIVWDAGVSLRQSSIGDVVGTGIYVEGGELSLEAVTVERTLRGLQPYPAYGLAATDDARVTSTGLAILSGDGAGVLHDSGVGMHTGLEVGGQSNGGVWAQRGAELTLTNPDLHDNAVAGLVATGAGHLRVEGGLIQRTLASLSVLGATTVESGDGLQVLSPAGSTTLTDVRFVDNARIGAVFDLESSPLSALSLSGVEVQGASLGCLAQDLDGLVPLGGWDDGVSRSGAVLGNDAMQAEVLDSIGTVSDDSIPRADRSAR